MNEDQDVSKYGFYLVIVQGKGTKDVCFYDLDDYEQAVVFKTEKHAGDYVKFMQNTYPGYIYYYKYVSWSQYD